MIDFHRLIPDGDVYLFSAVAGRTNLPLAPQVLVADQRQKSFPQVEHAALKDKEISGLKIAETRK